MTYNSTSLFDCFRSAVAINTTSGQMRRTCWETVEGRKDVVSPFVSGCSRAKMHAATYLCSTWENGLLRATARCEKSYFTPVF